MGASRVEPDGDIDVPQPDRKTLTEDELFELLANQRRRHIMHTLMQEDDRLDIGDLSQEIAAWEDDLAFEEVSSTDRKRVYTALQQSHLPKMDNAGVLEFDRDRGTIEPTPALEDVEIYMDVVRGRELPWSDYYLGLTALSAVLFVTTVLDLLPFSRLPSTAWGVFVIVSFAVSALAHRYYARRNRLGIADEPPSVELEYRDRSTNE
ncbi:DUF7344 domain-containing protein [Natrinema salaciae]|uniref:DUF7344 domain-containing protein n=1 Tax=Natrinema salaciae TaxID=1186196 RepID=A0A1H9MAE0_9EURY|nr:hypothetical protein [Natrinema salaciae]SER20439.1 hypothetical protein SAMN04489841_3270 [Natrinema salaciae]